MPRPGRLPDQRPDLSGRPLRHHLVLAKRGEETSSKEVEPLNSLMVCPPSGGTLRNLLSPVASSRGWRPHHHGGRLAHEVVYLHNVSMPNVLVRDLPDEVHAELQRRAEARGQSLQRYLAAELTRLTGTPPLEEVLERIASRRGGLVGLGQAVSDLDAERAGR